MIGLNVLSLPAVRQIVNHFENKRINLIGFRNCSEILLNEQLPHLSLISNHSELDELVEHINAEDPFDIVFDLLSSRISGRIVSQARIPFRIGSNYPGRNDYNVPILCQLSNKNTVSDYLDYLSVIGKPYCYEQPTLRAGYKVKQLGAQWLKDHDLQSKYLIILGVGAGNIRKRWPIDNYMRLSDELNNFKGVNVLYIVGPDELELSDKIKTENSKASVAHNLPLLTLKGVLAHASLAVSNDYSVMHMSAAIGIPTLAVFLSSDPVQWFPYSSPSHYVVGSYLSCRPCYREDCENWQCNDPSLFDTVRRDVTQMLKGLMLKYQ
jgi:ADP-heptose:LPS heptosyltransferase